MAGEGLERTQFLENAGFSKDEIDSWKMERLQALKDGGFSEQEVKDYFGVKEPDMAPLKNTIAARMKAKADEEQGKTPTVSGTVPKETEQATTFLKAVEAGLEMSTTGLMVNGRLPDTILPEHAPMYHKIASQLGTLAGDFPAMAIGAVAGGAAGTAAAPGVGTVVGAGAGGFALPEGMRTYLVEKYEKGEVQNWEDFWSRTAAISISTAKGAVIGGATAGAGLGAKALSGAAKLGARATVTAEIGAEVATMTTLGAAFEGKVPDAEHFTEAAILVGGLRGAGFAAGKLREIYAKTGRLPGEVAIEAQNDPLLKQELLSKIDEAPKQEPTPAPKAEEPAPGSAEPQKTEPVVNENPMLQMIGEKKEKVSTPYAKENLYTDVVDKLYPIKEVSDKGYVLSRMVNDAPAKVKGFLEFGVRDFNTGEVVAKPLMEIVKPFEKDLNGLKNYLIAKRVVEVESRGIKSGGNLEQAKSEVAKGSKQYDAAAKELVNFQNSVLKYLKDSGAISEEVFSNLVKSGEAYIPLKRISEEGAVVGGKGSTKKPIKALTGSEKLIQDPFVSIIEQTELYTKIAEKNKAILQIVKDDIARGENSVLKEVAQPARKIELKSEEIQNLFKEYGLEPPKDIEGFSVFRGQAKDLAPNQIEVFIEGKRKVYETDLVIAEAIKQLDGSPAAKNIAFRIAAGFTSVFKYGITTMPDFIGRNAFKDQLFSGVFTKGGIKAGWDVFYAMGDILKKREPYQQWLQSGGANGAFMEMGETYLAKNLYKLQKDSGNILERTWNVVKTGADYLKIAGTLVEQAPRLAEFKRVTKGDYSRASLEKGGFAAREITLDFQRVGARTQALNAIAAFTNVKIQGIDKTVRAFKDAPFETTARAATLITAPSILLWWANKDDERVKAIPRWQKDLFWIIPTDDWQEEKTSGEHLSYPEYVVRQKDGKFFINRGVVYRIPKPGELGVAFGSIPERILEKFVSDNPRAAKDLDETIWGLIAPDVTPNIAKPAVEQFFNKSFFTGNRVVPFYLEEVSPEYQYTNYTSETAKGLAKIIGAVPLIKDVGPKNTTLSSPSVIENYIKGWTGTMGAYALKLSDKLLKEAGVGNLKEKPNDTLADMPFVKAFVIRYPSASSQHVSDFYERYDKSQTLLNTAEKLKKDQNFDEYLKFVEQHSLGTDFVQLRAIKEGLSTASSTARSIENSDLSGEEKAQLIEALYFQMSEMARQGNLIMDQIDKSK